MFKRIILIMLISVGMVATVNAQELYPFSEPASNMPTKAIAVRLTNEGTFSPSYSGRFMPELMFGFNKNLMAHTQAYFSDFDGKFKFEGASLYAKYRFLSNDDFQRHYRMAAFAKVSVSNRATFTEDINLDGDNSGWQAGVIATQLIHKLAISATLGYNQSFKRTSKQLPGFSEPDNALNYSLSSGYLLLPFVYKDYKQPNLNLYVEFLGKTALPTGNSYLDIAPTLQLILNSRTRVDLGYRFELAGDLAGRYNRNMYLARVEFNFFNALK